MRTRRHAASSMTAAVCSQARNEVDTAAKAKVWPGGLAQTTPLLTATQSKVRTDARRDGIKLSAQWHQLYDMAPARLPLGQRAHDNYTLSRPKASTLATPMRRSPTATRRPVSPRRLAHAMTSRSEDMYENGWVSGIPRTSDNGEAYTRAALYDTAFLCMAHARPWQM